MGEASYRSPFLVAVLTAPCFSIPNGTKANFPCTFVALSKQTELDSLPRSREDAPGHRQGNRVVGYHPNSRQHTRLARCSVETCLARTGPKQPRGSLYSQAGVVTARVGYSHLFAFEQRHCNPRCSTISHFACWRNELERPARYVTLTPTRGHPKPQTSRVTSSVRSSGTDRAARSSQCVESSPLRAIHLKPAALSS